MITSTTEYFDVLTKKKSNKNSQAQQEQRFDKCGEKHTHTTTEHDNNHMHMATRSLNCY